MTGWNKSRPVASADGTTITLHTLGAGPGLVIVPGALQVAADYRRLARELGAAFTVHAMERRGRGASGPHGGAYCLDREREDLAAVQAETGASLVFGHSYGGLIVLEALAQGDAGWTAAAVYEPGVSIGGSIPIDWIPPYRELLAAGDFHGAFALFIGSSPQAPAFVQRLPRWYLAAALRFMPGFRQHLAPLLAGNAVEHEQVALHDDGLDRYGQITIPLHLVVGERSPEFVHDTQSALSAVIGSSTRGVLPGLEHRAPTSGHAGAVAGAISAFLKGQGTSYA